VETVSSLAPVRFVGIDWASAEHAVCVLDDAGRKTTSFEGCRTATRRALSEGEAFRG
jgi:hypothetical protein